LVRARHRLGASIVFASAATIAISGHAIPVYEIFKVGQDVHAVPGLDFFADFAASLSFVPHWNNTDGGADVDTSRCFLGMDRFNEWCKLLPEGHTTLGLDEHTGVILDFQKEKAQVVVSARFHWCANVTRKFSHRGAVFRLRSWVCSLWQMAHLPVFPRRPGRWRKLPLSRLPLLKLFPRLTLCNSPLNASRLASAKTGPPPTNTANNSPR
jgi:hypothetical protein